MTDSKDLSSLDAEVLIDACREETQKYLRGKTSIPDYCFELICRACRDQNEAALASLFTIYIPQLAMRAKQHPMFYQSCADADLIARTALVNFLNATKGDNFLQKFSLLPQVIAYMRICVHSVVLEDVRRNRRLNDLNDEIAHTAVLSSELEQRELLDYIYSLLPTEEHHLFYLKFVLEMKPSEIADLFPEKWKSSREVSVNLQTIRRHLRANEYLTTLANLPPDRLDNRADDEQTNNNEL